MGGWAGRAVEGEERSKTLVMGCGRGSTLVTGCGRRQAASQHLPAGFEAGLNALTSGLEERLGGEELSLFASSSL